MSDVEAIKRAVAQDPIGFAEWMLPKGKRSGAVWQVGDITGAPGKSLQVQLAGQFAGSYRDWAADERGDCIALVAAVRGLDFRAAVRLLSARYGFIRDTSMGSSVTPVPTRVPKKDHGGLRRQRPVMPNLEFGDSADIGHLAHLRNLAPEALEVACGRGLLRFFTSKEGRAWLITDSSGRNAQTRRLDGKPWEWHGKKAWTLRGSSASWPIGLPESAPYPAIALCEGGPDFLAAFHHALAGGLEGQIAPVCMVGASLSIPTECLPAFCGKCVRIFVHDDEEGLSAAIRWKGQLLNFAKAIDGFTFDGFLRATGYPVKDLCGLASIDADSWEQNRDAIESCMSFAMEERRS